MLKLPRRIRDKWLNAIYKEYKNLIDNNTFNLQSQLNENEVAIPTTMVFKAKPKSNGQLEKLKARCCARGDLEKHQDQDDNWSSCVSHLTVRTFIAYATKFKRNPKQLDFIGAYLQAEMKSHIFVKLQP